MRRTSLILALAVSATAFSAQAAPDPTASDTRFQIEQSGDKFIRLDKKTGAVSTCTLEGAQLDCRSSADERAALQAEIDRLEAEVADLKGQPATGSIAAPAEISKDGKQLTLRLPTEGELQQVANFFEDMINRLVAAVKDLTDGKA